MGARRARSDSGASAVEFALIMVPLLVLVFGLIQYGLYFWALQGGSDVARSAARLSAVGDPTDCATFRSDVKDQIKGLIGDPATATITRSYDDTNGDGKLTIGEDWQVSVEFKSIDLHFPFVPFIKDGLVTATAEARADYFDDDNPPEECS